MPSSTFAGTGTALVTPGSPRGNPDQPFSSAARRARTWRAAVGKPRAALDQLAQAGADEVIPAAAAHVLALELVVEPAVLEDDYERHLRRGDLVEERVEAPHLDARADDATERGARILLNGSLARLPLDAKRGRADADELVGADERLDDAHAVDVRAVRRREIGDAEARPGGELERRVTSRDRRIGEAHRAVISETHVHGPGVGELEDEALAGVDALGDDDHEGIGRLLLEPRPPRGPVLITQVARRHR